MIFKIFLTGFLVAMFLFITFGVKAGFSNKVRMLIRLSVVGLLVLVILIFFGKKIF